MARGYGTTANAQPRGPATAPTRFRCKVGGEWKPLDAFSNNQRKTVQSRLDAGNHVDAAHSGMVCREHSSNVTNSIRCDLCGLSKDRSQFSKSSLRNEVYKCVNCVAWTETQEPDVTPAPLQTGHVSAEEEGQEIWKDAAVYSGNFFGDDALPKAPITALSALGLTDEEQEKIGPDFDINSVLRQAASSSSSTGGKSSNSGGTNASRLPPHPRSFSETTSIASDTDAAENVSVTSGHSTRGLQNRGMAQLPPHLRGRLSSTASSSASSAGGSGAGNQRQNLRKSEASTISTATTFRQDEKERGLAYNAWDKRGTQHQRHQAASTATSSSDAMSLIDYGENELAEEPIKKEPQAFTPVQRKKGGWHKAPRLSATELHEFGNDFAEKAMAINAEIDHHRRYNANSLDDLLE